MVSGHLQVKKGYYYVVLSYNDNNRKRRVKYFSTGLGFPKRATSAKRKPSFYEFEVSLNRPMKWASLPLICCLRTTYCNGWTL